MKIIGMSHLRGQVIYPVRSELAENGKRCKALDPSEERGEVYFVHVLSRPSSPFSRNLLFTHVIILEPLKIGPLFSPSNPQSPRNNYPYSPLSIFTLIK